MNGDEIMFKEKIVNYLLKIMRYVVWFNWLVYEFVELHTLNVGTVIGNLCGDVCSGNELPLKHVKIGDTVEMLLITSICIYIILLIVEYIKNKNFKDYFINIISLALGIIIILVARLTVTGVMYTLAVHIILKRFGNLTIIMLIVGFIYDRVRIKKIDN